MPKKSKRPAIVPPTRRQDGVIIAAAKCDPEALPLTPAQLAAMVPMISSRGRSKHDAIKVGLALVFQGISHLRGTFGHRRFTIDGRLVGDIGEVLAELEYEVTLDKKSRKGHDAKTRDGKDVQIKATFREKLTFRTTPERYLGFRLSQDGTYEEIFNGPGRLIEEQYAHRKGIGKDLECLTK